jgi:hypothetical protein
MLTAHHRNRLGIEPLPLAIRAVVAEYFNAQQEGN